MPAPAVRSRSARSCRRTRQPRCARAQAAVRPANPPPTISAVLISVRIAVMLEERIAKFAPRTSKTISYRETGTGPALILMHGIGSGSAGWLFPLETLKGYRLIAWDAPGYGASALLSMEKPRP